MNESDYAQHVTTTEFWARYRPAPNSSDDNKTAHESRAVSNVDEFTSGVAGINKKTRRNTLRAEE